MTGASDDPTALAWRFSPVSNEKREKIPPANELRVVLATDVLSEGQNLQDCAIIVNFDLPWAIIRLIQRAGRVDRIGQQSETILCYSFLPADGVERIISLRGRVRQRLKENAEVVGTDEAFFDDEQDDLPLWNLYNEKSGILDGDDDTEVDLASYAYQIWKNAIDAEPRTGKAHSESCQMSSTQHAHHPPTSDQPEGVLVYLRTADGNDALGMGGSARAVASPSLSSPFLKAAACATRHACRSAPRTHHEMVRQGREAHSRDEKSVGGQLGRPSGARFRTYERLKAYADASEGNAVCDARAKQGHRRHLQISRCSSRPPIL